MPEDLALTGNTERQEALPLMRDEHLRDVLSDGLGELVEVPFHLTEEEWGSVESAVNEPALESRAIQNSPAMLEQVKEALKSLESKRKNITEAVVSLRKGGMAEEHIQSLLTRKTQGEDIHEEASKVFGVTPDELGRERLEIRKRSHELRVAARITLALYLREYEQYVSMYGRKPLDILIPADLLELLPLEKEQAALYSYTSFVLDTQYDLLDGQRKSPLEVAGDTRYVLLLAMQRDTDVEPFLNFLTLSTDEKGGMIERFLIASGLPKTDHTPERLSATRLLLGYVSKNREKILQAKMLDAREKRGIALSDALQVARIEGGTFSLIERFIQNGGEISLSDVGTGVENSIQGALSARQLSAVLYTSTSYAENGMIPSELSLEQKEFLGRDSEFVQEFMMGIEGRAVRVRDVKAYLGGKEKALPTQSHMILSICSFAKSEALQQRSISLLTHRTNGVLEKSSEFIGNVALWSNLNKETAAALQQIVHDGDLTLKEAFEMYYLTKTGGETGSFTETMKLVQILDNHGYRELASRWKTSIRVDLLETVYYYTMGQASNALNTIDNFHLSPEQEREMQNMLKYSEERGIGSVSRWYATYVQLWSEAPATMLLISGAALVGGGIVLHRTALAGVDSTFYFARVIPGFEETSIPRMRRFMRLKDSDLVREFGHTMPLERLKIMQSDIQKLLDEYSKYKFNISSRLLHLREAAMIRSGAGKSLDEIAKAIYKRGDLTKWEKRLGSAKFTQPVDLAEYLHGIAPDDPDGVIKAMRSAGISASESEEALYLVNRAKGTERLLRRLEALASGSVDDVKEFMDILARMEKIDPSLRRLAAEKVLGSSLSENQWKLLESAHKETDLRKKIKILENFEGDAKSLTPSARRTVREKVSKFLRLGIAGEVPTTVLTGPIRSIEQFRALLPRLTPDEIVEQLRGLPRLASELDPNEYNRILRDPIVRDSMKGSALTAELDDLTSAADRSARIVRAKGLSKINGKLVGHALGAFGLYLEYVTVRDAYADYEQAVKAGNEEAARIHHQRFVSHSIAAGASLGVGGLSVVGAVGGSAALLVAGPLIAIPATTEYLYQYELNLNELTPERYRAMKPGELINVLKGSDDWLLDGVPQRELRHDTALDAYVLQSRMVQFDALDDAYLHEVLAYDPAFSVDPYSESQLVPMRKTILKTKAIFWADDMREFLRDTNNMWDSQKPWGARLEKAEQYAQLKHIARRAKALEQPELITSIFAASGSSDTIESIRALRPRDVLSHILEASPLLSMLSIKKAEELFHSLMMIRTDPNIDPLLARAKFSNEVGRLLLPHDINAYDGIMEGHASVYESRARESFRLPFQRTRSYILMDVADRLFDFSLSSESEFVQEAMKAQAHARELLHPGKVVKNLDDYNPAKRDSYYGAWKRPEVTPNDMK